MAERITIEKGSVQETLVIPLYGRKLCAELFPDVYSDPSAEEICSRLDYDFSELTQKSRSAMWQFGALETAVRHRDMQWEINDYLSTHPRAAVVNMGCGLDMTGRACDNGTCMIYNVDMPDIIAAREELAPAGARETNIAGNLNDFTWMDGIDGGNGAVFFAAGVFHYFTFDQVKALVNELADRFPGARVVFDTVGKTGRKMMKKAFKSFGMENYDDCLFVEDPHELDSWCEKATVSSRGYMLGYGFLDNSSISGLHRFLSRRCDGLAKMRIIRMDFEA